jgi:quercetin dioxygenase-like cupin family protein
MTRTITNTATGERATYLETSRETAGARTVAQIDVKPGGGVPVHRHADHDERIEVLSGRLEVTSNGARRTLGPGEVVVIERGTTHEWRNASSEQDLSFRATMTPGHPDFERFLRVFYGLGRDGELGANKLPRRFEDLAILGELDPSIFVGVRRLLRPVMRWTAARARKRGREAELLRRYVSDDD